MNGTTLKAVADGLWEMDRPLRLPGLRLKHRMTVVRLLDGDLWVHSPVEFDETLARELDAFGPVRHFVAPSRFHDLYWPDWFRRFPEASFHCAPGVQKDHPELPFQQVLAMDQIGSREAEFPKLLIGGMPQINEFVFLHTASRTLIVADLVFNIDPRTQNVLGRLFLRVNGIYGRPACSRLFRMLIRDRAAFRDSVKALVEWDFDRLIPGHGEIVHTGAKPVLQEVLRGWINRW